MANKYGVQPKDILANGGINRLLPGQILKIPTPQEQRRSDEGAARTGEAIARQDAETARIYQEKFGQYEAQKKGDYNIPNLLQGDYQGKNELEVWAPGVARAGKAFEGFIENLVGDFGAFLSGGIRAATGTTSPRPPVQTGNTGYQGEGYRNSHMSSPQAPTIPGKAVALPFNERVYAKSTSKVNYSDPDTGITHYNGLQIPSEDFMEYLKTVEREPLDYDKPSSEQSAYWQNRIFVSGTREHMKGFYYGMETDNRDFFPDWVTPAQLALMSPRDDTPDGGWGEFIQSLGYDWDETKGAWIKGKPPTGGPAGTLGGGYKKASGGGGGGGGGYSYGGANTTRTGQYLRTDTGQTRADTRYAQELGGISPIHWRI